ncbi:uncharacterized protein LOC129020621 isoform X3 [Pongo pygmaeus]|uniref:uncharacterized protein LOC129020621 isoform X3 n=1 Tax=Pongo pygmaeus TaxID=9600 RepID=UPI00300C335F
MQLFGEMQDPQECPGLGSIPCILFFYRVDKNHQACSSRGTDDHLRSSESLGFCPLQSPTAFSASDLGRWTQGLLLDRAVEGAACLEDALRMEGAGADMMSDTSSGSLEVSLGSWETSFATVSPGESGHSWEDGDTCNRHWSFQDPE